jgi:hypothetical protein
MRNARLKDLSKMGAKLLNLVPGAGLEPARTRQGPRDFKSQYYIAEQYSWQSITQNATFLMFGACPYLLLVRGRLGTLTGTVTGLKFEAGQGDG